MRLFFLMLLCCLTTGAVAQTKPALSYRAAITFSPFALLQVDYTIMTGGEYFFKKRLSVVSDIGYTFYSSYLEGDGTMNKASGFIIRPGLRYYVSDRRNFYVQPQVFFKQVTHQSHDWVGKQCVNGVPAFDQLQEFRYRRNVSGFNAIAGVVVPLGKRAMLDFYVGLGARYKSSKIVDEPNSCYRGNSFVVTDGGSDLDNGWFPSLPGGIRLGFPIR